MSVQLARRRSALSMSAVLRLCLSGGIPRRSLIVAIVVGTILNLINQGDALLGDAAINWTRLILTFIVPYCVSTYGAVSALVARREPDASVEQ